MQKFEKRTFSNFW